MIAVPALLTGRSLGETVFRCVVALALLAVLGWVGWTFVSARWYAWRAESWKETAVLASQRAQAEAENARRTSAAAANASQTRRQMDAGTVTVRVETEESAERIERHAPSTGSRGVSDPDVMRELEAGDRAYRAAADRLRGERSSRARAEAARD